jgi:hypothetical protein
MSTFLFLLVTSFGALFLTNLALAVIAHSYQKGKEMEDLRTAKFRRREAIRLREVGLALAYAEQKTMGAQFLAERIKKAPAWLRECLVVAPGTPVWHSLLKIGHVTKADLQSDFPFEVVFLQGEKKVKYSLQKFKSKLAVMPQYHGFRRACITVVAHPVFENAIFVCIILNTAVLSSDYFDGSIFYASYIEMFMRSCEPLLGPMVAMTKLLGNPLTNTTVLSAPLSVNDTRVLWVFRELLIGGFGGVQSQECSRFFSYGPSDVPTVPAFLATLQDRVNYTLSLVFLLESALKLAALGWRGFMKDTFNIFDVLVATMSIVEIGVMTYSEGPDSPSMISALRAFRLIRMLKVSAPLPQLQRHCAFKSAP